MSQPEQISGGLYIHHRGPREPLLVWELGTAEQRLPWAPGLPSAPVLLLKGVELSCLTFSALCFYLSSNK